MTATLKRKRMGRLTLGLCTVLALPAPLVAQNRAAPPDEGLLVVYGRLAPTREGDIDYREQIFFSVPKDLRDRIYVRVFDPEMSGAHDFRYGGHGDTETVFRIYGGDSAFTGVERPVAVADGARPGPVRNHTLRDPGPGKQLREEVFRADAKTDGTWVSLGAVRARQGEVIGDRAWFRLDVLGTGGNDGNGFNVDVSLARDRHKAPDGLEMMTYQPTIRWPGGPAGTRVELWNPDKTPITVQNFDGAAADLRLNQMYSDITLPASGQNTWASQAIETDEDLLAVTLRGGFETPNDITLSAFDPSGAALAFLLPPRAVMAPERPVAAPRARALADCSSVAFDASVEGADPRLSYQWDFGDGSTSDEPVIVYSYGAPGRPTARLRVLEPGTRAARGAEGFVPVHLRVAPRAVAGQAITVAPGEMIPFDGSGSVPSDSPITRYLWTFGDGSTAPVAEIEKAYDTPGIYRALLRVSDDSDHPCNFGIATRMVTVNAAPVAEAGTDQTSVVGAAIRLSGRASYDVDGTIQRYSWDMGDGTVIEGPNVSYAYQVPGTFTARLTVTDDSGVANQTTSDSVRVRINAPPRPDAVVPTEPVAVGEAVSLDGSGSVDDDGTIISYLWDFGDGAMGEGQTVEYAWASPGVYDVTLTVMDDSATASAIQTISVPVIVNTRPVAEAGADQFVTTSEVTFDGTASRDIDGKILTYLWEFGDGRTGQGPRPTHSYRHPGTYEVALTVTDDSGAPQSSHRDTMQVTVNASPIADAGPALTVAPGEEFVLDAGASVDPDGLIARYDWRFPDGTTDTGPRLARSFEAPGVYRIGLSVTDDFRGGGASDDSEVFITVNAAPTAVAGPDRLIAPDETIRFDARRSHDADGRIGIYRWEFDDLSHALEGAVIDRAWPTSGIYTARLTVEDDSGVANATDFDEVTIRVNHTPVAEAGPEIDTDRLQITLDGGGSSDADGDALAYRWDFGDGSPPVMGREVTHIFPKAGRYPVTLWVDDGTQLANAGAVDATTVTINARPIADAGGNREVCSGQSVLFDGSGSSDADGDLLAFAWDFGDGDTAEIVNPTKTYERPGTYAVTLQVNDESGSERGTDLDRVAIVVNEGPIADAGPDRTVCIHQEVRLDGSASTDADGSVNAYEWTFGDGSRASGAQPVKAFDRIGTQIVTLTITGEAIGQCSPVDTDTMQVTVLPAKTQYIDAPARAPAAKPVTFAAVLGDEPGTGDPTEYTWRFSDGGTATGAEVSHVFAEPGVYFAELETSLDGGEQDCGNLFSRHKIIVNAAPEPVMTVAEQVAMDTLVSFDASPSRDADGAIMAFDWDFGDGTTASGVTAQHRFDRPGVYDVTLRVSDDAGTGNSSQSVTRQITVNPAPLAGLATPPAICPGIPRDWAIEVADSTTVNWAFGDGQSLNGAAVSHSFAQPGLYPVTVTADDGKGLANSIRSAETYVRVNAAPLADAGADRTVCPGAETAFSAVGSDLDGDITSWVWEFSDGVTLEGPDVKRVFDESGTIDVTLTVTDDSGSACAAGQDSARILVNAPPVVDAGPDRETPVGAAHDVLRFDASTASDPDGQAVQVSWAFGDQSSTNSTIARHRYGAPGTYTVTVTARDTTGLACGVATDSATVVATARDE
ncbi:PKD domain-containing protein [Shimia sp. SDUM112013]|uniref:PKD domain-containing protein n=1 Tax=Shimia sp. SDUM112013 TaxID=3136160 RepID=UPI0032ED0461